MKYLCLVYHDEKQLDALPGSEYDALVAATLAYDEEIRTSGHFIASNVLDSVQTATTIRVRGGKVSVTDGPFAETREQLGGYIFIEARDLNAAIRVASKMPPARMGSIEVRPIKDLAPANRAGADENNRRSIPMRKIVATEFVTLDGVMEEPSEWSFQFRNEEAAKFKFDELFTSDALLLGRVTYQGFAAAWPSMTDEQGFADRMNSLPKFVVSTTLKEAAWSNSTLISENIPEEVAKLKQQPGQDILIYGSADLVHTLMQHDLIDEYRLMVHPIVLGRGKRLFRDGSDTTALRLVDTRMTGTGLVILTYEPVARP